MKLKRSVLPAIIFLLLVTLLSTGCGTSDSPAVKVEKMFACLAEGDFEKLGDFYLPEARSKISGFSKNQKSCMICMGKAFTKVENEKIDDDAAVVNVLFDKDKLKKALIGFMAPKAENKLQKDMLVAMAEGMAKRLSKVPVKLIKKDGYWYVGQIKMK
ncbi:hypothetical protein [Dethiosulfatarculus sandiegensis]|uniref:DUF4878 domain-containing protein n=1 Tax=Dethiosulfatarculus sandiegensis TaxID=1429043 RepID=A0A0D2JJ50_9BACT|nr:hypothetical protein [Dethiosulfatarculus sandiegensis]KIX15711.1 hypothetical protein X474_02555 [Dethiosulfatarculus sandiegensis]